MGNMAAKGNGNMIPREGGNMIQKAGWGMGAGEGDTKKPGGLLSAVRLIIVSDQYFLWKNLTITPAGLFLCEISTASRSTIHPLVVVIELVNSGIFAFGISFDNE